MNNAELIVENEKLRELLLIAVEQLSGNCQCCGSDGIKRDDEPVFHEYDCDHLNHRFMLGWDEKPKKHKHCKSNWTWQHADKLKELGVILTD